MRGLLTAFTIAALTVAPALATQAAAGTAGNKPMAARADTMTDVSSNHRGYHYRHFGYHRGHHYGWYHHRHHRYGGYYGRHYGHHYGRHYGMY